MVYWSYYMKLPQHQSPAGRPPAGARGSQDHLMVYWSYYMKLPQHQQSGWQTSSRSQGQPGPSDGLLELLHEAAAAPEVRLADHQPEPGAARTI